MRKTHAIALGFLLASLAAMTARPAGSADTKAADALFAQREDPKKLEAAVKAYEDAGAFAQATRACLARLELHGDLKDDGQKEPWVDRGLKDGAKALRIPDPDDVIDGLAKLARPDAEALFYFAALYGRKIELCWKVKQFGMAKKFRRMAERAAELDGTVAHGGPHRMLGNFHHDAPGLVGGDSARVRPELDKAVEVAPKYAESRVMRAKLADSPAEKKADLEAALAAPDDAVPDMIPEQRAAKKEARALLDAK